jgi:hypothetical protein
MRVLHLHDWDIGTAEAAQLQRDLAGMVVKSRCLFRPPACVAGVDVGTIAYAVAAGPRWWFSPSHNSK